MGANFRPDLEPYKVTGSFRFWCQKVLPLVYDDSLSYYELLCKVVAYLNDVIENVDGLKIDIDKLLVAYGELEDYVNNYFDNLDVQQEINNKLDVMATDGTLSQIINEQIFNDLNSRITHVEEEIPRIEAEIPKITENLYSYVNEKTALKFNTLNEAKEYNFKGGEIFITKGYSSINDGGNGIYIVENNGTADGGKVVETSNGKFALLLSEINNFVYGIFDGEVSTEKLKKLFNNKEFTLYAGHYKTTDEIICNKDVNITVKGNVIIEGIENASTKSSVIKFAKVDENGNETEILHDLSLTKNSYSISANTHNLGLENGDIIRVSTSDLYVEDRGYYNFGELLVVNNFDENYIYFETPITRNYTNAKVQIVKSIKLNINGGKLEVIAEKGSWESGVTINASANSFIENISVKNTSASSIAAFEIYDTTTLTINKCNVYQRKKPTAGYEYGLSISTSQYITVLDFIGFATRHACSLGARRTHHNTINSFINVNGVFSSDENYSADMHPNSENCTYTGIAYNGVSCGGNKNSFKGTIHGHKSGYCVYLAGIEGYDFDFSNCVMYHNSDYNPFITIVDEGNTRYGGLINISNCSLRRDSTGGSTILYLNKPSILAGGSRVSINLSSTSCLGGSPSSAVYQGANPSGTDLTDFGTINLIGFFPYNITNHGVDALLQVMPNGTHI